MPKPNQDRATLLVRNPAKQVTKWVRMAKQGIVI